MIRKLSAWIHYIYPIKSESPYKFLPVYFLIGGGIEWLMINLSAAGKGETFYDVVRRKQSEKQYKLKLMKEEQEK